MLWSFFRCQINIALLEKWNFKDFWKQKMLKKKIFPQTNVIDKIHRKVVLFWCNILLLSLILFFLFIGEIFSPFPLPLQNSKQWYIKKVPDLVKQRVHKGLFKKCWSQEAKCAVLLAIVLALVAHSLRYMLWSIQFVWMWHWEYKLELHTLEE